MPKPRSKIGKRAERFIRTSGVFLPSSPQSFWSRVEATLGAEYVRDLEEALEVRASGESTADAVYDLLFRSPVTALITVSAVSPFLEPWLAYLENAALPEGDVLDLGCGNGLSTAFLASMRPDALVVGIDASEEAVAVASEIAKRLNIANVRFEVETVDEGWHPSRKYPVVTSATLLREIEPDFPGGLGRGFSTIRGMERCMAEARSVLAEAVDRALDVSGIYVSLERHPSSESLAAWIGAQQQVGICVDLTASEVVAAEYVLASGAVERLPALRSIRGGESVPDQALLTWLLESEWQSPELRSEVELKRHPPISLVGGWHLDVHDEWGPGQTRLAVLLDGVGRYHLYLTTSRGSRQILETSAGDPARVFGQARAWIERAVLDPVVNHIRELEIVDLVEF